ncbi:MAG: YfhO family protein, partial [Bryobacterales bacterium]|nr:YfhO family protein [Bryobacterales bacterium]
FGAQLPDHPRFYLSFLLPHLYDHNRTQPGVQIWEHDYMYLGATALLGFLVLLARPSRSAILPVLTLLAALLLVLENPYSFISDAVRAVPALPDALRTYNFISGLAFVGALCAAAGVDALLRFGQPARPSPWLSRTWGLLVILWSGYLLFVARQGGPQFVVGLASAWYAIVAVVLVGSGIWLMRAHRSAGMVALLLLLVFTEFRVFGVNRRSNAVTGDIDAIHAMDARAGGPSFVGMDDAVFAHVRRHPDFRIALPDAPATTDMRHYRLATPQGFDPFVNRHLKAIIENHVPFRTNREYDIPPHSHDLLDLLGVGFFIAVKDWETAAILRASPDYELLQPSDSFFQVFARRSARPAWNFEAGTARMVAWEPERRLFSVRSDSGGTLALLEQRLPGWRASVDGLPATTQPWGEAFQAVTVPPGEHLVEFRYFPNSLLWGAAISLLTGLFAVWLLFGKRTPNASVVRT